MAGTAAGPEILTERLVLSALADTDATALLAYRSDPCVSRFQTWEPRTLEDARLFIERLGGVAFDTPGTWFQFGIRLRPGGELVGDLGVHFDAEEPRQVEVGVTVSPAHQGAGLATEALEAVLAHLFDRCGKHRVVASVDPRNVASIALMRRAGMAQEAHFRRSLWLRGEWVDDLVFAMLASDDRPRGAV
jgi:RimJ/RimL family protein N-acetyltransferase